MAGIQDEEDISLRTRRIEILSELSLCIARHVGQYFVQDQFYSRKPFPMSLELRMEREQDYYTDPYAPRIKFGGPFSEDPDMPSYDIKIISGSGQASYTYYDWEEIQRNFPWLSYFGYNPGHNLYKYFIRTGSITAFVSEQLYLLLDERVDVDMLEELRVVLLEAHKKINQLPVYSLGQGPYETIRIRQDEYRGNFARKFQEIMIDLSNHPIVRRRIPSPPKATRTDADKIFETFFQHALSKNYELNAYGQQTQGGPQIPYSGFYDYKIMKLSSVDCYLTMLNQLIEVQHQERSKSHATIFWRENMDREEKQQEAQRQSERTRNNAELFRKQRKERKQSRRNQRKEKKAMGLENVNAGVSPNLLPENLSANNPKGRNTIEKKNVPYIVNPNSGNNINNQKTNRKNRERKASKEQLIKAQKAEAEISQERASRIGEVIRSQSASRAERNSRRAAYAKLTENARLPNQGTSLNGPIVNTRPPSNSRPRPKPKPRKLTVSYRLKNAIKK
jgi:hypothetical protein